MNYYLQKSERTSLLNIVYGGLVKENTVAAQMFCDSHLKHVVLKVGHQAKRVKDILSKFAYKTYKKFKD